MPEDEFENIFMASGGARVDRGRGVSIYYWKWPLFYIPRGIPRLAYLFNSEVDIMTILYDEKRRLVAGRANNGWPGINRPKIDQVMSAIVERSSTPVK